MRESLYDYCTRTRRQALLEEWDVEGNGALPPLALSHGSRQKVWWRCGAGHRWQAAVYTRTGAESGCPYCAGKRPWPGFNDLASQEPALAALSACIREHPGEISLDFASRATGLGSDTISGLLKERLSMTIPELV